MDRNDRNHPSRQGCPLVRRNLKKVDDEIVDLTNRKRIRGLYSVGHPANDGEAQCHSERCGVNPTGLREEANSYLRRSSFWSVHTGLPGQQCSGTGAEKSAEAIVALPGEGLNLLMQGADGRFR